jgi:non-haem dioxygenase in morphine synthesis N-terminal
MSRSQPPLPVIDLSRGPAAVAGEIGAACRESGFFHVAGHGVPAALVTRLEAASRDIGDMLDRLNFDAEIPTLEGTYGDHLVAKVSRVFPQLRGSLDYPS